VCVCVAWGGGVARGPDVCRMAAGKVVVMYVPSPFHEPTPPY
jgi:hypothetical protein